MVVQWVWCQTSKIKQITWTNNTQILLWTIGDSFSVRSSLTYGWTYIFKIRWNAKLCLTPHLPWLMAHILLFHAILILFTVNFHFDPDYMTQHRTQTLVIISSQIVLWSSFSAFYLLFFNEAFIQMSPYLLQSCVLTMKIAMFFY